jgi:hypothetical protein
MYKVDLKTLNEITATLDTLTNIVTSTNVNKFQNNIKKAQKLSQKIKDNYTQIKK